jgi:hypothetical protein
VPGCGGPCADPSDTDCDGLRDHGFEQDPWPGLLDGILLSEHFATDPFVRWASPTPSLVSHDGPGKLRILSGGALKLGPSCASVFQSPDYLVEVSFSIDGLSDPYTWSVMVESAEGSGAFPEPRLCRLWREAGGMAAQPIMQVKACGSGQAGGNQVSVNVGSRFLIQSWGHRDQANLKHVHMCRLLSPDGKVVLSQTALTVNSLTCMTKPGTVAIRTDRAGIVVSQVRAFREAP